MRTTIVPRQSGGLWSGSLDVATGWFRRATERLLSGFDGGRLTLVSPDGAERSFGVDGGPTARLMVRSPRFYRSVILSGTVGAAQSYMRGEWECDDLVAMFRMFARDRAANDRMEGGIAAARTIASRIRHRLRANTTQRSRRNIHAHYDLGNEFFELFLDPTMTYSSGIFESEDSTMEQASNAKIDRLCDKLRLGPEDHLLEIGTGWGSLAIRAAQRTGCRVTSTTLSAAQAAHARRRIGEAGLEDRVQVLTRDYRELDGAFDKLVSVEMIEAVGHAHLPDYFEACGRLLAPHGMMALQAITVRDQRYEIARKQVDVIQEILFPGSDIPSVTAMLSAATSASDLNLVHLEDITPHYARTLSEWRSRFHANIDQVRALGNDESFLRLWHYYLCYCEAGFAERYTGCVQMMLAKPESRPEPILPPLEAPVGG